MTGRILVVCSSGASSTFLAQRLRALAEADGLEIEAVAGSIAQVRLDAAGMDVVLLGAHLADRLDAVRAAAADEGATAVLLDADAARPEGARAALDRALAAMRQGARSLRLAPGLHGRPVGGSPPVA
ncbi:PTS sugar transporter subunit IIB [Clavibacter californiensis]|nr:PTS sugar transporter subunit IIABC [Clavibacter californiensis]UKF80122.1 PTS sugar transporter subunit IIABC [Clavibacter californiensis]